MKYQMPEPAFRSRVIESDWTDYYTATQVQAAFDAGRVAGLEEAAERVECEDIQAPQYLADAIRNLKETPCA